MGASSSQQHLKAMDQKLDMEGMMGKWYVISCIPTVFEKGAHNAVENYSWRNGMTTNTTQYCTFNPFCWLR
jgi:lipocalin